MKIRALTGLRFVAAFYVVLFHVVPTKGHFPAWLKSFASYGDASVGFFFVLSGFVLTYSYVTPDGKIKTPTSKFLWARFARIYPVYLFAFLLFAPVIFFLPREHWLATAVLTLLLLQSWFGLNSWNVPGWSLCNEAFFYLCWPLAIHVIRWPLICLWGAWLAAITPTILGLRGIEYLPIARLPEFLMGMCFSLLLRRPDVPKFLLLLSTVTVALTSAFAINGVLNHLLVNMGLLDPIYLLVIYGATVRKSQILSSPLLQLLGDSSYCLYIIQSPVFILAKGIASVAVHGSLQSQHLIDGSNIFICCYIVGVVLCSIATHKFVEIPIRECLMRRYSSRRLPIAVGASA
jgi:peptidoglycan/LPS O-acetylase OafA/YrhL